MGFGKLVIEATNTDHVMVVHKDSDFGEVSIKAKDAKTVLFTFSDPKEFEFFEKSLDKHPAELQEIIEKLQLMENKSIEEKELAVKDSRFFKLFCNAGDIADAASKLIDVASKITF